mmetsp:Transcript_4904/g.6741  ORF Transcript_4904/g.6741 Transcript_4904/m.6741 type:complete len:512 (-) Transcript_4904:137-1672(-)|eukprot:CAMPEP_0185727588 /NCGR_PEP_ID=MMETSP1171-20130828/3233_1 /TAXON_ID=374046 /ORGANISM="Helicotheca tamensis, Strain CCMP826" /LENGTH=511 /DNA_ID=CAMNT_0028396183 /DNA_START=224 /DNA_END=1759 /DNA_ORIENTATION=+
MWCKIQAAAVLLLLSPPSTQGFIQTSKSPNSLSLARGIISSPTSTQPAVTEETAVGRRIGGLLALQATRKNKNEISTRHNQENFQDLVSKATKIAGASLLALSLSFSSLTSNIPTASATTSSEGTNIALCLFQRCQLPLLKCITNPKCLANVICINTCNNRPDEIGCQIQCGDIFENSVVGEFNKCALSEKSCVPQKADDGSYPVPSDDILVKKFDTKLWNGKWYITAGQNKLFDIFPCQVHFFEETAPGTFFGKLNWRIVEPDGEFFTRDALQRFVQDPKQPAHLVNHDNEYLHYEDDWYIIDYAEDNNPEGVPPFAFVYYRGANDAWIGYGGVVVYTRESQLPTELLPRLREAATKIGYDFDKDFTVTDNTCKVMDGKETLLLREQFAGKVALQTEEQLAAAAVRARSNAANSVQAQKIFFEREEEAALKAYANLNAKTREFEDDIVGGVVGLEKELVKDVIGLEKEIVKDVVGLEKEIVKDVTGLEKEIVKDVVGVEKEIIGKFEKKR